MNLKHIFLPKPVINEYFTESKFETPKVTLEHSLNVLLFNHTQFLKSYVDNCKYLFNQDLDNKVLLKVLKLKMMELLHFFELNDESDSIYQLLHQSIDNEKYRIESVVKNNFNSSLNVEEMAFLCDMSVSSFKRKFKELFKTSPGSWITNERMMMAQRLLNQNRLNVSQVANSCGYSNISSFGRIFKRKFGLSPSDYQSNLN